MFFGDSDLLRKSFICLCNVGFLLWCFIFVLYHIWDYVYMIKFKFNVIWTEPSDYELMLSIILTFLHILKGFDDVDVLFITSNYFCDFDLIGIFNKHFPILTINIESTHHKFLHWILVLILQNSNCNLEYFLKLIN